MKPNLLLFSSLLLAITNSSIAQTELSGEISGRLTIGESPYLATDTITVPAGESLEIDPGVEIFFDNHMGLMVFGRIEAVGTEEDSIRMLPFDPENGSRWAGITIDHGNEGSILAYCHLETVGWRVPNGNFSASFGRCLTILNTTVEVFNSLFSGCLTEDAIYVYCYPNRDPVTFSGNTIANNRNGLQIISCNNVLVEGNEIYANGITGLKLWGCNNSKVIGNIVELNSNGIEIRGTGNLVLNNIIRDNVNGWNNYGIRTGSAILKGNEISSGRGGGYGGVCSVTGESILIDNLIANESGNYEGQGVTVGENNRRVLLDRCVVANQGDGGLSIGRNSRVFLQNSICRRIGAFAPSLIFPEYSDMPSDQFDGEGVIAEDPLFVNRDNDFHLQEGSPCIASGSQHPFFRNSDHSRPDMGCYNIGESNELVFGFTTQYQFPTIGTFNIATDSFLFCNLSEEPIRLARMELSDPATFSIEGEAPLDLEPFVWYWFPIRFNPIEPGEHEATIEFTFDDYEPIDRASISLSGTALDGMSGFVSGVLRREFSPYHITGDIEVPWLDTLLIEPGVELRFDPGVSLRCRRAYSAIIAEGTEDDSIKFVSAVEDPDIDDQWNYFDVDGSLAYCLIQDARRSLSDFGGTISHSTIQRCGWGINLWPSGNGDANTAVAEYCLISDCDIGVLMSAPDSKLLYSVVMNCREGISSQGDGLVYRSLFAFNETIHLANIWWIDFGDGPLFDYTAVQAKGNIFYRNDLLVIEHNEIPVFSNNCIFESPTDSLAVIGELVQENVNGVRCDENFNFEADPRLVDIVNLDFTPMEGSPCIDAGSAEWEPDADGSTADIGPGSFDHNAPPGQIILTPPGWSLISLNVFPSAELYAPDEERGPDLVRMFAPFEGNLEIIKDYLGRFYLPERDHFNNIPYWDLHSGCFVKTSAPIRFFWEGERIEPNTPIPLHEGWNIAAYYPQYHLSVSAPEFYGFESVVEHLIIAKDQVGNFALPSRRFSNLPLLTPGQGYLLKLDENIDLIYPPAGENLSANLIGDLPVHFIPPTQAIDNMSILLEYSGLVNMCGEIAVLNKAGICLGVSVFECSNTSFQSGIAVWGDDPTTNTIDGALSGDSLIFKLWNGYSEQVIHPSWIDGSGTYKADSYAIGTLTGSDLILTPVEFSLSAFPNPFNSSTTISFSVGALREAPLRLAIYDINGRMVADLLDGRGVSRNALTTGQRKVTWDASNVGAGVYFVRLEAGRNSVSQKTVILR